MTRAIAFVVYPGFQLLDAAGPISAFEIAERYSPGAYRTEVLAPESGVTASSSGVGVTTKALHDGFPAAALWAQHADPGDPGFGGGAGSAFHRGVKGSAHRHHRLPFG